MKTPISSAKHHHALDYSYGALANESINDISINPSLDDIPAISAAESRRWSVFEKLDRRHYCRIRSCSDCFRIMNSRCLLATIMLGSFVLLILIFTRTILLTTSFSDSNHYDFIIVGAGPAGCIITNKLVNHGAKVLLLEAGGPTQYSLGGKDFFAGPISRFDIPLMWSAASAFHEYHWHGFNMQSVIASKGLGGGGFNNAMIYIRALASDITGWKLDGWDWNTTLSHYLNIEDYGNDDNLETIPNYHSRGGPLRTTRAPYVDEIAPEFVSSAVQYGIRYTTDFNDPNARMGVGYYDFNIRGGLRDSVAREFLAPLINADPPHTNFNLKTYATARKILFNPNLLANFYHRGSSSSSKSESVDGSKFLHHVLGVEYEEDGVIKTAYLSNNVNGAIQNKFEYGRAVVITSGAILTPKLLMNSGIGPRQVLQDAGIDVKIDHPWVGKNLQDHPAVGVTFRLSPALASSKSLPSIAFYIYSS
jgi:choline dehydrogenase